MNSRICVAVGKDKTGEAFAEAAAAATQADVVEIRLDYFENPDISVFLREVDVPLLFTNRADWEGGLFSGAEAERIAPLLEAVKMGAAYVDLELRSPEDSWQRIGGAKANSATKVICSWHNFKETPSGGELHEKLEIMKMSGASIGKIVTMAKDYNDVLRVLSLQSAAAKLNFPLIAFCMGEAGIISRVATTALGGYMTYCSPDSGVVTAPGQVAVSTMRSIFSQLEGRG